MACYVRALLMAAAQHAKAKAHPVAVAVALFVICFVIPVTMISLGTAGLMLGILTAWIGRGLTKV